MPMSFEGHQMAQSMTLHPRTRVLVRLRELFPLRRMSLFLPSNRFHGSLQVVLYNTDCFRTKGFHKKREVITGQTLADVFKTCQPQTSEKETALRLRTCFRATSQLVAQKMGR